MIPCTRKAGGDRKLIMIELFEGKKYIILTGNYGSGKTELALNLAMKLSIDCCTTLVDLDIVNPYFRSAEKEAQLTGAGIRVLKPSFAMTTVDIPALPAEIASVFFLPSDKVIFDVGGDDTGAAALGQYHNYFSERRDEVLSAFVINCMRPLTREADDIIDLMKRVEARSRLSVDMLINNTNLADRSTPDMLLEGEKTVRECMEKTGIKRAATSGMSRVLYGTCTEFSKLYIERQMKPEWMDAE